MGLGATESALEAIEAIAPEDSYLLPTEIISKTGGGIVRCVNADGKPFAIKSGSPAEISFVEPVYVGTVEIEFSKSFLGIGIELSVFDALTNRTVKKKLQQDSLSSSVIFAVNCVTSGITVLLQPGIFELFARRTLELRKINVFGYLPEDFEELTTSLTQLQGLRNGAIEEIRREKSDVLSRQEKVQQREIAVSQLEASKKAELAELEASVDETADEAIAEAAKLTELKAEISRFETRKQSISDQIAAHETTVRNIEGEVAKGKEELRVLAVETSESERRLHDLTNNINLFSEEFSSFADNGANQARMFIVLSLIPLVIIAILSVQLLLGAVDLTVKYTSIPKLDLVTVFVTRLPYLAVCISILAACSAALSFLFTRISHIYAERLDFSKIGIVAKDVAYASANNLDLDDEQLYEARTYLKIEMLKSYLGGNIGAFTYTKRQIKTESSVEASVVEQPIPFP